MTGSNVTYAFVAYAIVWVVLFGYIVVLGRRLSQFESELEDLAEVLRAEPDLAEAAPPTPLRAWAGPARPPATSPAVRPVAPVALAGERGGG